MSTLVERTLEIPEAATVVRTRGHVRAAACGQPHSALSAFSHPPSSSSIVEATDALKYASALAEQPGALPF